MSVNKDKNGKWYASFRYKDYDGTTRQKKKEGFATRKAAQEYERDFLNRYSGNSSITFENLCKYYLDDCSKRFKASSVRTKTSNFNKIFLPMFGKYPINEITPLMVRQLQNTLIEKYKPTSQKTIYGQFAAAMNFASKYYGLANNPCNAVPSIGTMKANKIHFFTLDDFNHFIAVIKSGRCNGRKYAMKKVSLDYYVDIFTVLFYTGMRIGELLALTVSDFDAAAGTLTINKTFDHDLHIITTPKTDTSNRTIDLTQNVRDILQYHIDTLPLIEDNARIFPHLAKSTIIQRLQRFAPAAGLPKDLVLHDFRHSHAALLIHLGVNPLYISKRLGHADVKTTLNTYGKLYPSDNADIIHKLENL